MADLTITAANVVPGSGAKTESGHVAGETIAAGKAVYLAASGKYMLADSNSVTAGAKKARGIALNSASLNQPLTILTSGQITIGATMTAGATYFLSDTPGGICPDADVGAGEDVCLIGAAASTTVLNVGIQAPGVAR